MYSATMDSKRIVSKGAILSPGITRKAGDIPNILSMAHDLRMHALKGAFTEIRTHFESNYSSYYIINLNLIGTPIVAIKVTPGTYWRSTVGQSTVFLD